MITTSFAIGYNVFAVSLSAILYTILAYFNIGVTSTEGLIVCLLMSVIINCTLLMLVARQLNKG